MRMGWGLTSAGTVPLKPSGTQSVVFHPLEAMADARARARVAGPALSAIAIKGATSYAHRASFLFPTPVGIISTSILSCSDRMPKLTEEGAPL